MKNFQQYLEAVQSKKLWLDDERTPVSSTWEVVRNQEQFENAVRGLGWLQYDQYSFDNDLGEGNGEGYSCAQFLVNQVQNTLQSTTSPLKLNLNVRVHSWNPVASKNTYSLFLGFFKFLKTHQNVATGSVTNVELKPAEAKKEFTLLSKD